MMLNDRLSRNSRTDTHTSAQPHEQTLARVAEELAFLSLGFLAEPRDGLTGQENARLDEAGRIARRAPSRDEFVAEMGAVRLAVWEAQDLTRRLPLLTDWLTLENLLAAV